MPTSAIELGTRSNAERRHISRAHVLKLFAALALVTFLLRIFYAGHLYQDDGLWLTAAEEIVRGKALYREIYFDKPPALPLVYAGLFKLFGAHIIVVRLFGVLYSIAISGVLYLFGGWLYGRREGLIAAGMFAIFSTTYTTGHVQGLNSDFLMALPYTAGAYLLVRSWTEKRQLLALGGGALVGIAFQVNPKAIFDFVFFAAFLFLACGARWAGRAEKGRAHGSKIEAGTGRLTERETSTTPSLLDAAYWLAMALAGFIAGALPFMIYIVKTRSLSDYLLFVWDWGSRYASYYSLWRVLTSALRQSAGYFALNNTLLITLVFVTAVTVMRIRRAGLHSSAVEPAPGASSSPPDTFRQDITLLTWFAASYLGMAVGGRFFGHYFFQIMPALCLIGARGLTGIASSLKSRNQGRLRPITTRAAIALLALGFIFTLVRFHGRTAALALDWARGSKSAITAGWFHERLKREERAAAAVVREFPEGAAAADRLALEALRDGSPRQRATGEPSDFLFIWGYRPEIYYWSGLLPASRYLSSQPLTGVPADVHFNGDDFKSVLDESHTSEARRELVRELQQAQPKYIIDELGKFNAALSIKDFPELREFMKGYKNRGATGRFFIYQKKDPAKKQRDKIQ